jgi:FdrA protein
MVTHGRVRPDAFVDSVALMQVTERVRALPGVRAAALVMATELNQRVLDETDLWPAEVKRAGSADLVIVVRADSAAAADAALGQAEAFLAARRGDEGPHRREPPRSITGAARRLPGANLAVVSVPGAHAAAEAHQALSAGLHVFLFSDGVSLEDEIALKQRAKARGLLVMGPECGTSLVNGVGLGFANRVRRGQVGLVAASGTGLQEVASLIHRLGAGVSQGIGTGGRDLHEAVGGLATLQVLSWLARDAETRVIGLISKAPSASVARRVLEAAAACGKPVVAYLSGWLGATPAGVVTVTTLEAVALGCVGSEGGARGAAVRDRCSASSRAARSATRRRPSSVPARGSSSTSAPRTTHAGGRIRSSTRVFEMQPWRAPGATRASRWCWRT